MNLHRQLLLVSLLLLSLPWAGCQFVREMEGALQRGQEQALQSTARAVATVLRDKPSLLYPDLQRLGQSGEARRQLYATPARSPIILDGYADGWEGPVHGRFGPIEYRAHTRGDRLYLLFSARVADLRYEEPGRQSEPGGDRLLLRIPGSPDFIIASAAPGPVQARYSDAQSRWYWEPRIRGYWQDSAEGFTVELELPLSMTGYRLGFSLLPASAASPDALLPEHGSLGSTLVSDTPWLVNSPPALQDTLAPFADSGIQLSVIDRHHWEISRVGAIEHDPAPIGNTPWPLRLLYRALLNGHHLPTPPVATVFGQHAGPVIEHSLAGETTSSWYSQAGIGRGKTLLAAAPILSGGEVIGSVLVQQNSERYLSLTDQAFSRLVLYSLLALAMSTAGLLGYASWLSWRIRRLSVAAGKALRDDGSLSSEFPVSRARDEVGDLGRAYAGLLEQLREYTDYLRSLSRKLSHELRTPIAVIRSSLDNLEQDPADQARYLERARQGTTRLSHILTAMSEATRLEESITANVAEDFDLSALCREVSQAYRELHPEFDWQFEIATQACIISGSPDLLVQMLDKLVDNATGFTPAQGRIGIELEHCGEHLELRISNEGPCLPEAMKNQLFDSMVSVRQGDNDVHLGLGLHISRLIAEFHRGSIHGENLPDNSGVRFIFRCPTAARPD